MLGQACFYAAHDLVKSRQFCPFCLGFICKGSMLPVALCVSECAYMQTGFFNWCGLRLLWWERGASMHKHQQGLYGSHSRVDMNHNARGWPQRMQGHSYPCRKLCRGIRATGRLGLEGLDAGLLMGKRE